MITEKSLVSALLNNNEALALIARDLKVTPEEIIGTFKVMESAAGKTVNIYIDGGARGNPGQGGAGVVLHYHDGKTEGFYYYFDHITNNAAEYKALLYGLDIALSIKDHSTFHFFTDSQLMARQINGEYQVKNEGLAQIYTQCIQRITALPGFRLTHVPREQNKDADRMVNIAIDTKKMGKVQLTDALN